MTSGIPGDAEPDAGVGLAALQIDIDGGAGVDLDGLGVSVLRGVELRAGELGRTGGDGVCAGIDSQSLRHVSESAVVDDVAAIADDAEKEGAGVRDLGRSPGCGVRTGEMDDKRTLALVIIEKS